jgi:hypothetical protein
MDLAAESNRLAEALFASNVLPYAGAPSTPPTGIRMEPIRLLLELFRS